MTAILNKKVLLSAGAIVFTVAMLLTATYAAFTATANIDNNTLATANVSISAVGTANASSVVSPVNVSNVLPGYVAPQQTGEYRTLVTNTSSVPLNIYMYVDSVTDTSTGDACDMTKIAYQSSLPNSSTIYYGYFPYSVLTSPEYADVNSATNYSKFFFLSELDDVVLEKVPVALNVAPGAQVAVRTVPAFATAATNANMGGCTWSQVYYGETI